MGHLSSSEYDPEAWTPIHPTFADQRPDFTLAMTASFVSHSPSLPNVDMVRTPET
jgi:hypothetical protein